MAPSAVLALSEHFAHLNDPRVERCINRLKQFRRVATRYENVAANDLAMVTLAAGTLWL